MHARGRFHFRGAAIGWRPTRARVTLPARAPSYGQSARHGAWAVSSAVEHLVYTERVGGSRPSPPTRLPTSPPARFHLSTWPNCTALLGAETEGDMHKGSCLCGAVHFEVDGELPPPDACHCTKCRKHSGHYFASTDVPRDRVRIVGMDAVSWYQSSEKVRRGFCSVCGSSLFFAPPQRDW